MVPLFLSKHIQASLIWWNLMKDFARKMKTEFWCEFDFLLGLGIFTLNKNNKYCFSMRWYVFMYADMYTVHPASRFFHDYYYIKL